MSPGAGPDAQRLAELAGKLLDGGAIAADFTPRTATQSRQIPIGAIGTDLTSATSKPYLLSTRGRRAGPGVLRASRLQRLQPPAPTPTTQTPDKAFREANVPSASAAAGGAVPTIRQAIEAFENRNNGGDGDPI